MREALRASRPAGGSSAAGVPPNKASTIDTKIYMWNLNLYWTSSEHCLDSFHIQLHWICHVYLKSGSINQSKVCWQGPVVYPGVAKRDVFWGLPNMYPESYDCGLSGHLAVMRAAMMEPGVHTMSDELILQISCNIFLAFKLILMMTSGQNISHHTTARLSVHVWNHDLIWWQCKIDTQKHFHKTTITSSWTLSKTKIPITIVKAQIINKRYDYQLLRQANSLAESWHVTIALCLPLR